ncbi:MAG: hypothetical protein Q4E53_07145 [Eubacteriales bacterium]|nr:hypothetical protein [Eubacteriales bacterium]
MGKNEAQDEVKEIGDRLNKIQKFCGKQNEEMPELLAVSKGAYLHYKSGLRQMNVSTLFRLCESLKPNMNYLFYGINPEHIVLEDSDFFPAEKEYDFEMIVYILVAYLSSLSKDEIPEKIGRLQLIQGELLTGL